MVSERKCSVCNRITKIDERGYCLDCQAKFTCRPSPTKMLRKERIKEAESISETFTYMNLPKELKMRRLGELLGRKLEEKERLPDIMKEIKEQKEYPIKPWTYKVKVNKIKEDDEEEEATEEYEITLW